MTAPTFHSTPTSIWWHDEFMEAGERELIQRAQGGDTGAFKKLVEGNQTQVFNMAMALTGNWANAAKANLIRLGRAQVKSDRKSRGKYGPVMEAQQKDDDLKVAVAALISIATTDHDAGIRADGSLPWAASAHRKR